MQPSFSAAGHYDRPGHRYYQARGKGDAFGELELGDSYIRFHEVAEIDAVIAELTALRAEMAGEPEPKVAYRLVCGCTDWCNCDRCRAGKVHVAGMGWHCGEHGRTEVAEAAEVTAS